MRMQSVKSLSLLVAVAAAAVALAATDARADERKDGPYMHADLGAHWIQDVKTRVAGERVTVKVDPGIRFSVGAGYRIHPTEMVAIGFELDTGFIWNSLDRLRVGAFSGSLSGDVWQVPFLANGVLTLEPAPRWALYLGGGGGGIYSRTSIDRVFGLRVRADGSDVSGAVQALGGLRYEITDRASLGLGFKWLNVFVSGDPDVRQHSIGLNYNLSF
jgi:opacity protein-like surface antigen